MRYWLYIVYLFLVIVSMFVLAWDSDHYGQKIVPSWAMYIFGTLYFSFWIKMFVEVIIPHWAFWQDKEWLAVAAEMQRLRQKLK